MTLRDRLAEYLKDPENAGAWIDGRELATIGGSYAWRSRISDCRTQLGMQIENRQRYMRDHALSCPALAAWDIPGACNCGRARRYTVSEYRYVPPPDRERERYEDDGREYGHPDDMRDELRGL